MMVKRKRAKQAGNLVSLWFYALFLCSETVDYNKRNIPGVHSRLIKGVIRILILTLLRLLVTKCLRKKSTNLVMEDEKSQNIFQVYITVYLKATVTLVDLIARVVIYAFQIKLNA